MARAQTLGIQRRRHVWTCAQLIKLRKLYPRATRAELRATFPGLPIKSIEHSARLRGRYKARLPLKPTGDPLFDAIRVRCFRLNYSMTDLDAIMRTGRYFRGAAWGAKRGWINYHKLRRAIDALGGTLSVTWQD